MIQRGQVFKLTAKGADGEPLWAYRYRLEGRSSARPQVGGFATRAEAQKALRKALDRIGPGRGGFGNGSHRLCEGTNLAAGEGVWRFGGSCCSRRSRDGEGLAGGPCLLTRAAAYDPHGHGQSQRNGHVHTIGSGE